MAYTVQSAAERHYEDGLIAHEDRTATLWAEHGAYIIRKAAEIKADMSGEGAEALVEDAISEDCADLDHDEMSWVYDTLTEWVS